MEADVEPTAQWAMLVLVVVATVAMLWGARQKRQRLARMEGPARVDPRQASDVRGALERLMVELHDMCREMNARLDTKMNALEQLITDADARIAQLERLMGQPAARPETDSAEAAKAKSAGARGTSRRASARGPGDSRRPGAGETPAGCVPGDHQQIYAMSDQGLSLEQIAQKTGKLAGEVELILSLRGKETGQGA